MEKQTPKEEGTAVPTPSTGMSEQDSASKADPQVEKPVEAEQPVEEKSAEVKFAEKTLGREFTSQEEAEKAIVNLKSLVGDQTISKQRKALESLYKQTNLSVDELIEVIDTQGLNVPEQAQTEPTPNIVPNLPDDTTKRVVRIETDAFIKEVPEAKDIRDSLFAKAIQTGKPVKEIWDAEYASIFETGKKIGAKKLQTTTEGQPLKATDTDTEPTDTKVNLKELTSREIEEHLGYRKPTPKL